MSETKTKHAISEAMRVQLSELRADYTVREGKPFRHFFCPMLLRDDDVELCMGHVINEKIPNSSGARVVQRKDVDGFYGRAFEPDFMTILEMHQAPRKDAIFDPALSRKAKPKIMVDGEECPHYLYRGTKVPSDHTGIQLEHPDGEVVRLVLKKRPEEFVAEQKRHWQVVVERDSRVTAVVSVIKAAYLTLFRMLGYRYALSAAGLEIGHYLLGNFFTNHGQKSVEDAREAARAWFRPYVNIMRPIERFGGEPPRGTIEDGVAKVCFGSSGNAYAMVVCVRTNTSYQAVLMPVYKNAESAATYHDFLNNNEETLRAHGCEYKTDEKCWHGTPHMIEMRWPKGEENIDLG
jgi:hypothetical protein